jgi:hypothetical protein
MGEIIVCSRCGRYGDKAKAKCCIFNSRLCYEKSLEFNERDRVTSAVLLIEYFSGGVQTGQWHIQPPEA